MHRIFVDTSEIFIEKNSIIFDDGRLSEVSIHVTDSVDIFYTLIPDVSGKTKRSFFLGSDTHFVGSGVFSWSNMVSQVSVIIDGARTQASLELLALGESGNQIAIDGVGRVEAGSEKIKLRIDQTNILLGDTAHIQGKPILEIATDTIEGGHSCKVHRIAWESLFYLQSHGIDVGTAEGMLLEAEILKHTSPMGEEKEILTAHILEKLSLRKVSPI